jgi:hypothetical protein
MQHSTPEMKTKLLMMDLWTKTSATQDGIALLKTIRNICHKKDGSADATIILDLIRMDKDMFLVHQAPTEPLSSYLSKFKGAVDVVKSLDGSPWSHPAATKIVFDELYSPSNYALDKTSNLPNYQTAVAEAQRRYLAALFFHGLSNEAHRDPKKKIHNDALTGSGTVLRTYYKVLQLADQYKSSYHQRPTRRWQTRGWHRLRTERQGCCSGSSGEGSNGSQRCFNKQETTPSPRRKG